MLKENQILICRKEPGKEATVEPLFENTLEAFQKEVGGLIEVVTLASDLCLICNEEGRLLGLPYNVKICGHPFVGTVLAVGVKGEEFASIKGTYVTRVLKLLDGV